VGYSSSLVQQCFTELEKIGQALQRKQWQAALDLAESYSVIVQSLEDKPEFDAAGFGVPRTLSFTPIR